MSSGLDHMIYVDLFVTVALALVKMDRNVVQTNQYKFKWRARHTTAVVGEVLYCWGGDKEGLDESHDSSTKRQCTSAIDAFNLLSGVWSSQPTSGTPPLGIRGVSCAAFNNNIYYFGGYCGHDSCFHNSLNCLDTLTLQWNKLQPTDDNFVNKRAYGGMIAMGSEGEPQQLLVIGGIAPISTTTHYHSQFKYKKIPDMDERVRINEQNMYNLSSGQWIVPSVSGQCCPPTDGFIIERISHNKGIMYGGGVSHGGISIPTNSIYLFQLSHCNDSIIINWEILKPGAIPVDGVWPKERCAHASAIINGVSTSPTLVVIGGMDHRNQLVNDCLLLDTNRYNWMKIPLPDSVTGRYYHTVSSFVLDPNHVFLIIVGGDVESMDWINRRVPDPLITMLIELVFNDGQWSVGPVLDSFNIPLLYELILKERRKESYMTNKVKELQVINESLRHDLQVARTNNQSLQEALLALESEKWMLETQLLETKTLLTKQKRDQEDSPHSDNAKKLKTDESVEEKQIITDEDNEKLRATVAYNEVYITEIEEEKKQLEEQYLNLKTKVADNELYTAKLMKEKEQLQERVTSLEERFIKETSTKEVQFDYMIPSMDNLECLSDVQVAGIQHCVDLTGRPDLAQYLKFAIAPVDTPSLPYQFSIVQEGEFSSNSGYGSIQQSTTKETNLPTNTVSVAGTTTTPNTDHVNSIKKAVTYAGLVYYEEDGVEDLVTFTAAKNLEALIHFIEQKHSQARTGPDISFCFKFPYNYIELNLTAQQDEQFTGWILRPHTKPTRLYQEAIDKFGDKEHSHPSCCLISVYGSPDAVPFLNYFIPLEGVAHPVSLNIHRARRNFTAPVPPLASNR
ncbi:PREDICTED: uncharacterized protein LOC109587713 [Amphimedon queenslandica]|uniref:Uncharacterized protein n=1 Tax=Amphimedon queenslandica TaxID=400682 RepID=A0AAN0JR15_AMPQE|nr:PREDICTED: uncharacterized protein LOC109587713 [Amphimedon queenslandica]|eukprot:XP_019859496.1 PREDICTED: uncharacterized protein LOC109587713 [Amphimedon queenslandica]